MTPLLEGVGIALTSLRAHKLRAALTILGVAIGVMVVMVIGALIAGFDKGLGDMLDRSARGRSTWGAGGRRDPSYRTARTRCRRGAAVRP
jgi:hypothetical protein